MRFLRQLSISWRMAIKHALLYGSRFCFLDIGFNGSFHSPKFSMCGIWGLMIERFIVLIKNIFSIIFWGELPRVSLAAARSTRGVALGLLQLEKLNRVCCGVCSVSSQCFFCPSAIYLLTVSAVTAPTVLWKYPALQNLPPQSLCAKRAKCPLRIILLE